MSIAPPQERPPSYQELQDRCATLEARAESYFKLWLDSESRVQKYAAELRIFGVFWSACLAHRCEDDTVVLAKKAPQGFLYGLADSLALTVDDFRRCGYVLHEHEPIEEVEGGVGIAARFIEEGNAYRRRHPEQGMKLPIRKVSP